MHDDSMATPSFSLPKPLMLGVSFCQGICLTFIYQAVTASDSWLSASPITLYILAGLATAVPTFFLLLVESGNQKRAWQCSAGFALVMALVCAYTGWQNYPLDFFYNNNLILALSFTMGIASFKALMYAQEYCGHHKISYASLFHSSWRNFFLIALAALFTLIFFGILYLWSQLFLVIGIAFFRNLFRESWFIWPAGSVAFGFAIIIFRSLTNIIDSIAKLFKALITFLLPLLVIVSLIFLVTLLFTGVNLLWQTNMGSGLILWLQALTLFFVNAVYQADSNEHPYPLMVHRIIYAGIAVLPIYSLIAFYGLFSRISQYGLTVQRCWGVFIALILFLFAIGYLWSILRKKDNWLEGLAVVNIRLGLVVMSLLLLINTPVASFQMLTTNNQISRLENGTIEFTDLDLFYFNRSLGRQGYLAVEQLKLELGSDNPEILAQLEGMYQGTYSPPPMTLEEFTAKLQIWPEGRIVPDDILLRLPEQTGQSTFWGPSLGAYPIVAGTLPPAGLGRFSPPGGSGDNFYALFIDMNNDSLEEIIIVSESLQGFRNYFMWYQENNVWQSRPMQTFNFNNLTILSEILDDGQVFSRSAEWNELILGDDVIRVPVN